MTSKYPELRSSLLETMPCVREYVESLDLMEPQHSYYISKRLMSYFEFKMKSEEELSFVEYIFNKVDIQVFEMCSLTKEYIEKLSNIDAIDAYHIARFLECLFKLKLIEDFKKLKENHVNTSDSTVH